MASSATYLLFRVMQLKSAHSSGEQFEGNRNLGSRSGPVRALG